jgi:copper homeostasis protein
METEAQKKYIIEIATTDFATTKAAVECGADRIELCSALSEGGLTPSFGLLESCRQKFNVEIFPIIRPREGDFFYTDDEFEVIKKDILQARQIGCNGVVIGLLLQDGSIDVRRTEKLIALAYPLEVTFHRAFDRCKDPFEALEQLILIGCNRILTSGQKPTAVEGLDLLAQLVQAADERIIIMPGSGVRQQNINLLAEKTGAVEFHSSLRSKQKSSMTYIHPAFAASEESYVNPALIKEEVQALRLALSE